MKLDDYEADILQSVENGEWKSRGDIDERIKELQNHIKHQKKKAISIRIGENDIYELKKKLWKAAYLIKTSFRCLFTSTLRIKSS